jgi:catechol 2,3-dioxygenase-like lactoylglutathione lyase family enzyme
VTERMIPILPCRSIDETLDFYRALGFGVTYRQERPNTYAVVQRGGIELQFFVLKTLDPANSYSSCYVVVSDVDALYGSFRDGLLSALGRLPSRGIPRISGLKDMSYGVRQFIVVDPGGNYIRIGQPIATRAAPRIETAGRLERALGAAVTLADSKGDDPAAAKVLDSAFSSDEDPPIGVRVAALILRAELAYRLGEPDRTRALLDEVRASDPSDDDRAVIVDDLRRAADLEQLLAADAPERSATSGRVVSTARIVR